MEFKDYYKTLGVARDATADDIKKAHAARLTRRKGKKSADAHEHPRVLDPFTGKHVAAGAPELTLDVGEIRLALHPVRTARNYPVPPTVAEFHTLNDIRRACAASGIAAARARSATTAPVMPAPTTTTSALRTSATPSAGPRPSA